MLYNRINASPSPLSRFATVASMRMENWILFGELLRLLLNVFGIVRTVVEDNPIQILQQKEKKISSGKR